MALVKMNPQSFEQSFNNLVDDFFYQAPSIYRNGATNRTVGQRVPANILKAENGYTLELMVPGFTKEAFNIGIDKGLLTVSASVEADDKPDAFVRREYRKQSFSRTWTLGESVDAENITAHYENGVLTLNLPTKATTPVKQIAIQ